MPLEPDIIQALVSTIEIKDLCTAAHTWRVVMYTRAVSERLGLDADTVRRMTSGAALHDLGKIDIPDEILQKPAALSPDEFEIMKTHTTLGFNRLKSMGEDDALILAIVRSHHERMDGLGYPDKLEGDAIPLPAQVFAVVDSFDAMTSVRPYHPEFGTEAAAHAMSVLHNDIGTHYAPKAVATLAGLYEDGDLDWILSNFNDRVSMPSFRDPDQAEKLFRDLREREA